MINLLIFVFGFLIGKFYDKIFKIIKQFCFILKNYKMIKKSKYYNDFYEDFISSQDFERGGF